ncbi:MAG: hypothetical protein AAGK97_14205, partial [Bacteroidota bacterium]
MVGLDSDCMDTLDVVQTGANVSTCAGPFEVELLDNNQVPLGTNVIDASMINTTLMYSVTDQASGISCWKSILVEDGGAPLLLNCPPDDTIACYTPLDSVVQLTEDDVMDCSEFSIFKLDSVIFNDSCIGAFRSEILRRYVVVDDFNNADTCFQSIFITKPTLADVQFPSNFAGDSSLICNADLDTSITNTGVPMVDSFPILNGTFCNLSVSVSTTTS